MARVLAADIGATNARFALVERPAGEARIVFERTYPTASFPDFEPALATFLGEAAFKPARGAIAIAGPIEEDAGRLLNRSAWSIEGRALAALGIEAKLINDFEALAYGVAHAGPDDWIVVQAGETKPHAAMAAVGVIAQYH
jgi:glucokinase